MYVKTQFINISDELKAIVLENGGKLISQDITALGDKDFEQRTEVYEIPTSWRVPPKAEQHALYVDPSPQFRPSAGAILQLIIPTATELVGVFVEGNNPYALYRIPLPSKAKATKPQRTTAKTAKPKSKPEPEESTEEDDSYDHTTGTEAGATVIDD